MHQLKAPKNKFDAFAASSRKDWQAAAASELQGGDPWKKLSREVQGFTIKPYFSPEDVPADSLRLPHQEGSLIGPRTWFNCPRVTVSDAAAANAKALEHLQNGADGIFFELSASVDFKILFRKIEWPFCSLNFLAPRATNDVAKDLAAYMESVSINTPGAWYGPDAVTMAGKDNFRPYGNLLEQTDSPAKEIARLFQQIIQRAGQEINTRSGDVAICVELGTDFFVEIAKLRAIRQTWQRLLADRKAPRAPLLLHGWSRAWEAEAYTPNGNMIRGTTAAMAAIMGGCDVVTIDAGNDDIDMERRIARNTAILLREESRFAKVADPLAGAWFVDSLTAQLVEQVSSILKSNQR